MDEYTSWQAFACTGNIYRYLDYKRAAGRLPETQAGINTDEYDRPEGALCDLGTGFAGSTL